MVAIRELVLSGLEPAQRQQIIRAAFEEFAAPRLFGSPHLAGAGSLLIVAPVATNSPALVYSNSASGLTLSWPADHIGWRLQVQTNSLGAGLGTNWWDVANATNINQLTLPVNATSGSVFFRLVYP